MSDCADPGAPTTERAGSGPLRLLWLHQNFVTRRQPGNSRAHHQLTALLERGWRVDVVTTKTGYLGAAEQSSAHATLSDIADETSGVRIESEGGLAIERLSLSPSGSQLANRPRAYAEFCLRGMRQVLRRRRPDVILSSSPPLPQVLPALFASVIHGAPLVLEVRDLWPFYVVHTGRLRSPPLIFLMEWLEATAYRYARDVIATSPMYPSYLEKMGVSGSSIHVLPTGADVRSTKEAESAGRRWREQEGLEDRRIALYAGSFNEHYDIEAMLEAAARLSRSMPDLVWLFAGNGRQVDRVRRASRELGCVRYLGNLPKDDLFSVYAAADVGLVSHSADPVLRTALSGKVFDCLAAALPIVTNTSGITTAVAEASGACLLARSPESDDPVEALAVAIHELFSMSDQDRRRIGEGGRSWARENMDSVTLGRATAAILERHAGRGSRLRAAGRLIYSVVGGLGDALTRRARASAAAPLLAVSDVAARDALDSWLERWREESQVLSADSQGSENAGPSILSQFRATSSEFADAPHVSQHAVAEEATR